MEDTVIKEWISLIFLLHDRSFDVVVNAVSKTVFKHHKSKKYLDQDSIELILGVFLRKCPKCNKLHSKHSFVDLYIIMDPSQKKIVADEIDSLLTSSFDSELYYYASIVNIIDFRPHFSSYLEYVAKYVLGSGKSARSLYRERLSFLLPLNEMINLCYHNQIDTKAVEFDIFRGISEYYDWLLDINSFNYKKFSPLWVIEYGTDDYGKYLLGNERIKTIVKKYIMRNAHPRLSKFYIRHTYQ